MSTIFDLSKVDTEESKKIAARLPHDCKIKMSISDHPCAPKPVIPVTVTGHLTYDEDGDMVFVPDDSDLLLRAWEGEL